MGIMDNLGDMANKHHDKLEQGIEQAGDFVDSKTGDKYKDQVDRAQDFANQRLDQHSGTAADPARPETDPAQQQPAEPPVENR